MRLSVRVQPWAGCNAVEVAGDGTVRVRVIAAPEGGKANGAAVELLAKRLRVPKGAARISRGHRARDKTPEIDGITPWQASVLLSGWLLAPPSAREDPHKDPLDQYHQQQRHHRREVEEAEVRQHGPYWAEDGLGDLVDEGNHGMERARLVDGDPRQDDPRKDRYPEDGRQNFDEPD